MVHVALGVGVQRLPEDSHSVIVNNRQLRQTALVTTGRNPYILNIIWQRGHSVVFFLPNVCLL